MPRLNSRTRAAPLLNLLRQGMTPGRLALTLALGFGIGCFPVFGTTTMLCALVAIAFRLNMPAIQVGNYLALPLQLLLLIPFLRLGERIFHAGRLTLSPQQLVELAQHAPERTMLALVAAQWHAMVAWLVVTPWIVAILALALRPVLRLLLARAKSHTRVLPA